MDLKCIKLCLILTLCSIKIFKVPEKSTSNYSSDIVKIILALKSDNPSKQCEMIIVSVRYELNVIYSQAVVDCSKQLKNSHEYNVIGKKKTKIQMIVITYGCNCQITDLPPLILR